MGEAKRKANNDADLIWHHTSALRTNLLWMSGEVRPEGEMEPVPHPQLGMIGGSALRRRSMSDFPPLAWFTRRIEVPRCLVEIGFILVNDKGEEARLDLTEAESNAMALTRIALGFSPTDIGAVPWPEHPGYTTREGEELNETAREVGDDPRDWFVTERPADIMKSRAVRIAKSRHDLKMVRNEQYLKDVHRMVQMCRDTPETYIAPSWAKESDMQGLAQRLGVRLKSARD